MPSTLSDFNNKRLPIKVGFGVDINTDTIIEDYTNSLSYTNILETCKAISGVKSMNMDAELNLQDPDIRWSRSGILTDVKIATSSDNFATEHEETIFSGSTIQNNSIPFDTVQIQATSLNDDYLDRKASRQVFENDDIADIMESLLLEVGVDAGDIDLSPTGYILPVYFVSNNYPIRMYIEDLAKGALQVVGFNREGKFSSNTILKNDFDGSFPTPDLTVTLSDIIKFTNREIRSNMYYNDITVRSYEFDKLVDTQFYVNTDLSGYSVENGKRLFFELELEGVNPLTINELVARNSSSTNLYITWQYRINSYYEFFDSDSNGTAVNTGITLVSTSIIPTTDGKEKILIVWENNSGSTKYLKQIFLNGTTIQRRTAYETSISDEVAIEEDGKRIPLVYESNAIQGYVRANELLALIELNLSSYANVYTFEIQGRPQLEIGSVIDFQDRNENEIIGVVYEIDSEISQDAGYSQLLTVRTLAELNNYFALDDPTRGLDDINYQLL